MLIFSYMVLLRGAGLALRAYQIANGQYDLSTAAITEDVIALALTYHQRKRHRA